MNSDIAVLRRAVDDAARIIAGITPAQLDDPTPCEDFTVGKLVDHLGTGLDDFAVRLDGGAASTDMTSGVERGSGRSRRSVRKT